MILRGKKVLTGLGVILEKIKSLTGLGVILGEKIISSTSATQPSKMAPRCPRHSKHSKPIWVLLMYAFEQKLSSLRNWKYSFSYDPATSLVLMDAQDPRRTCRMRGFFDHRLTAVDHPRPFGGPTEHTQLAPVCSQPSPHQEKSIWLVSAY